MNEFNSDHLNCNYFELDQAVFVYGDQQVAIDDNLRFFREHLVRYVLTDCCCIYQHNMLKVIFPVSFYCNITLNLMQLSILIQCSLNVKCFVSLRTFHTLSFDLRSFSPCYWLKSPITPPDWVNLPTLHVDLITLCITS